CRRSLASGQVERCWSYAATALADERRYDTPFGNAEALSLDEQGAWIGVDNNAQTRRDGEKRPIVWRFAAPKGSWGARQWPKRRDVAPAGSCWCWPGGPASCWRRASSPTGRRVATAPPGNPSRWCRAITSRCCWRATSRGTSSPTGGSM